MDSGSERRAGDALNKAEMCQKPEIRADRAFKVMAKRRRMAGLGPNPGYVSYKFSDSGQNT